ncbi:Beta-galactosidase [Thermobaculum terrenum ATCC BAA-798]|uniref:Beta-galactosidase n=1 Tax=Thermobaculum terrenum (strain ATCC BAA-798 / CCMEE 7001 / YNP1) TaxID=525904 RepID=D1CI34_THET1|nr:beta-galactosidase [Thermobaculum terrenum]ACZ43405.1 Beta-galactosidase [Thermobaculum terrenum ATCC BAA-798]
MRALDLLLGVCYYPEQVDPSEWEADLARIREAGLDTVRIGELIWSGLEPEPGRFRCEWLDEVLELCRGYGLAVVLGTPTATLPPWLVEADPEVMPVDDRGVRAAYGSWGTACLSSQLLWARTELLVDELGRRYGRHPAVIGWQLDNELPATTCYCQRCRSSFHNWLERRYGDVSALNEAWGTAFLGQGYTRWGQVPAPLATVRVGRQNPGLLLDYVRFQSELACRYLERQAEILRRRSPGRRLTHNIPGMAAHIDYHRLFGPLDVAAWDVYPGWIGGLPHRLALGHDVVRGLKRAGYWVLEQQVGRLEHRAPPAGALRLWTYQAVAHGAEVVLYFPWRQARGGSEQYIASLLTPDGRRTRSLAEVERAARELQQLAPLLRGTEPRGDVALLWSYEDHWALALQPQVPELADPWRYPEEWYLALRRADLQVDVLSPSDDRLRDYRLLVAPSLYLATASLAERLRGYVEAGGTLLLGPRSGSKDEHNAWPRGPLPGPLGELVGATVEEFEGLPGGEARTLRWAHGDGRLSARAWCELLAPAGAEPLLLYADGPWPGSPAAVRRQLGAGRAYYLGCMGEEVVAGVLLEALRGAGVARGPSVPAGGELVVRAGGGRALYFVLNHAAQEARLALPAGRAYQDPWTGDARPAEVELPPYGVEVLLAYVGQEVQGAS